MKAVRLKLSENMDVAKEALVSKSMVENETYLFRAACAELKTEVDNRRKAEQEDMGGFIDEDDDADDSAQEDSSRRRAEVDQPDDLDDLEAEAERARARHKGRQSDAMDVDPPATATGYVRHRLVIESDGED